VQAFEPISMLGAVISPIVCKVIGCKNTTNKYIFIEHPAENRKRLSEMRDNFKWGDYYEEGECTDAKTALDKSLTVCYTNKEWRIVK
jgi:hypothetical protein|tara:strand:- start:18 stop:278 length:261 start_codon:yes stop_codon:yes gene_type:complete